MKTHKKRELATSLTTFLFLVISVTGVMMFFHILDKYTKQMHEILGLVFVVIVVFHVFFNWKSMKKYFSNKIFFASGVIVSIAALAFVLNTSDEPNPKRVVFNSVFNKPIEKTYVLFSNSYENAKETLVKKGIKVEDGKSIKELAQLNKVSPFKIISILSVKSEKK